MGPYTRHTRHNSIEYEHILVYHVGIKISCSTCTSIMAIQSTNTHTHTTSPLHHSTACPITACPITHPHPRAKTQHRCWRHRRRSRYFRLVGGVVIGHVVIEEVHSTDHDSRSSQGVHTPCVHARARTPRVRPTTDDRRRRRRASARTTTCGRRRRRRRRRRRHNATAYHARRRTSTHTRYTSYDRSSHGSPRD